MSLSWIVSLLLGAAGAWAAWARPVETAVAALGGGFLAFVALRVTLRRSEAAMKSSSLYLDRYWTDEQKDALERHALYWRHRKAARGLSAACLPAAALLTGAALVLVIFQWALAAVAVSLAALLLRESRNLDPLVWMRARQDKGDYSVSESLGAVMDIEAQQKESGWNG